MAASINNRVEGESTTSPLTLSGYTPTAGSNQKLVVMIGDRHSTGFGSPITVTYDGNSLTFVIVQGNTDDSGAHIFELDEPTALAASGDIVVTVTTSGTLDGIKVQALTLLGVKAGVPASKHLSNSNFTSVSTISGTLFAAWDDSVLLSVCSVNGTGDAWTPVSPLTTSASDTTGGNGSVFWADDILADGSGLTTIKWDDDAGTNSGSFAAASFAAQGSGGEIKVAVVSGTLHPDSAGTADFTKSGFGTPRACVVIVSKDITDDTSVRVESRVSIGFSDFSSNFCIIHQDEDASAKVDCDAYKSSNAAYGTLGDTGTTTFRGTASTITDGVRLTHTFGSPSGSEQPFATVIMFGGADLTVALTAETINSSQDGTATRAHSGFTDGNDKLIFFVGTDISSENSASTGINNSFGVCHATGSDAGGWTFTQRCMGWASDHNATEGEPRSTINTDQVLSIIKEDGTQDWSLEVTDFSSSGDTFTVTTRDAGAGAGMEVYSLALDLDDRSAKVGDLSPPTSGTSWSPSVSLGFTPQYVGLGLTSASAKNIIQVSNLGGNLGISSNTGSGEETCHSWYNEDNSAVTNTNSLFRSRAIDFRDDDVSTVLQDHSHSSFDSGGWTYTINTENEPFTRWWFYWTIEAVAAVGLTPAEIITMLNRDKISPIRQM